MQILGCGRVGRFFVLLMVPVVALSMGGCPPQQPGGGGGGNTPTVAVTVLPSADSGSVGHTAVGNNVTLTATPADGWLFDSWSGADVPDPQANPLVVDGTQITSITANFAQDNPPGSPADTDGDGVRDDIDQCPETTRGTPVDANGCPANAPPGDTDGDGVADTTDQCPNSPTGAPVDADGCAANQRDTDGDGVTDNLDACDRTPSSVQVDNRGCPVSAPGTPDADSDGVPDDIDQCPNTIAGAQVDANGCSASQRDSDADGVKDDKDQCPGTIAGTTVDANGCPTGGGPPPPPPPAGCGNGVVGAGEQCDDGNTNPGDGCSATCQLEGSGLANDLCGHPTTVGDGTIKFTNVGATTDGPDEPTDCLFFGRGDIPSDVWFCYTATCTGTAAVGLCGSGYDTKMAVYSGCGCPSARPVACSDDDCGSGVENTPSRATLNVTAGQSYLIRVGGYPGNDEQGEGRLTISCGQLDICTTATGDCMTARGENQPGCGTPTCCNSVCAVDRFCCDVTWDSFCASEASGLCTTGFPACNTRAGACTGAQTAPGCNNVECCNGVCQTDPFCCITAWDQSCADRSNLICTACGRGQADCFTAHAGPGCSSISCCGKVCADAVDKFCCDTEWDASCAQTAATLCQ